jgi:hypothetical protein
VVESEKSAEGKKVTSHSVEDLAPLIDFETKILLISIRRPTAPQFDLKFRGWVRKGGEGGRNTGAEAMGCNGVRRA